jgi:hypothetical protein
VPRNAAAALDGSMRRDAPSKCEGVRVRVEDGHPRSALNIIRSSRRPTNGGERGAERSTCSTSSTLLFYFAAKASSRHLVSVVTVAAGALGALGPRPRVSTA